MKMDELVDIELDSEGQIGGAVQTVRKSISLNLTKKTKLKAKGSAKSGKYKKERRAERSVSTGGVGNDETDNNANNGGDAKRGRAKPNEKTKRGNVTTGDNVGSGGVVGEEDEREDEELDWSHKVVFVGEKIQDPMIHVCEQCNLPILVYGRLIHCKHILCYSCAQKASGKCPYCSERIERIEPAGIGQIFVCSYGGSCHEASQCRRSYLSQRDLIAHIKHRHEKEGSTIPDSELLQQGLRLPFLSNNGSVAPTNTTNIILQQQPALSAAAVVSSVPSSVAPNPPMNPVMMSAMPPPAQPHPPPPMFAMDGNRLPMLPSQPQFQPMPQPLQPHPGMPPPQTMGMAPPPQAGYPPAGYIPHSQYQAMPPQQPTNNPQQQQPRPEDMRTSGGPMQSQPPPPPPQGEWRGGPPPNQMGGNPPPPQQDWNQQARTGNYQPQQNYYK